MRVECESCHELVTASFSLEAGAVRAVCPACRHAMVVPVAPSAAPEVATEAVTAAGTDAATPAAADAACPKCGAPRRGGAASCPSCGLAVARMAAYVAARDAEVLGPVREAWARATEAWSDPARHDELLRLVAAHNAYAWAAGRYRTRGGDPIAGRQLDRLRRAAEATLLAGASVRPDRAAAPYRAAVGILAILIAVVLVGLVYATVIRQPPGAAVAPSAPAAPARPLVPGHPLSSSTVK